MKSSASSGYYLATEENKSFINLSKEQYIKLRSEKTANGIDYHLNNQFVVKKVGTEERDDFQDAGIEYYEYLN